ncbi:non-specific serine/threonine protein kinase [Ranunculus cassubicifolius]
MEESPEVEEPPEVETDPTGRYSRSDVVLEKTRFYTVYRGFDNDSGSEIAWKQILVDTYSLESLDVVNSAIVRLKALKHKNLIKVYRSWVDKEKKTLNIMTELYTSDNLRVYREKHKKVDLKAIKGWAKQILEGLNYLHSQSPPIVHGDLKPANIFMNGHRGEVKIGDLGFTRLMEYGHGNTFLGDPEFRAPEIYTEKYNELVDVYSFGMCLLEMVTREHPYSECEDVEEIQKKIMSGIKPDCLSRVDDLEVKILIEKCLTPAAQRLSAKQLLRSPFFFIGKVPEKVCSNIGGVQYHLQSKVIDDKKIHFILGVKEPNCDRGRNIDFDFYLDTDTPLSVIQEMVDEGVLGHRYSLIIAEMVEEALIRNDASYVPAERKKIELHPQHGTKETQLSKKRNAAMREQEKCLSQNMQTLSVH